MKAWIVAALVIIGVLLGIFATFFAQGAPTTPTAQLYTSINPGQTQSLVFELNMGDYSVIAPNTVWGLGMHFYYTAVEQTSLGQTYILANQQPAAPTVGTSSGFFYQLWNALTLTTTAACSGINCAGVTENVTVTTYGIVNTPLTSYQSPTSVSVFSSLTANTCSATSPCTPTPALKGVTTPASSSNTALYSFVLAVAGPLTLLVAVEAFGVWVAILKHPILPATAAVAFVVFLAEFFLL